MCLKVTFSLMSVVDIFRFLRFGSEFELIQFLAFQIKYKMRAWGGDQIIFRLYLKSRCVLMLYSAGAF